MTKATSPRNPKSSKQRRIDFLFRLSAVAFAAAALASCSTLKVTSQPEGARVVWSPDGSEPWRDRPPRAFGGKPAPTTPFSASGRYGDAIYVSVEKDGYRRPLPQVAQLYTFRRNKPAFVMDELPDALAERKAREGQVLYLGEWVDPAEKNLVVVDGVAMPRAEAERIEMAAKGLVQWQDRWVLPAERERLYGETMKAEGKTLFKERWVMPEVVELETKWDDKVAAVEASGEYLDLGAPKVLGRIDAPLAQLQIFNNSGLPSTVIFSGPTSRSIDLEPYQSWGIQSGETMYVAGGRYNVAMIRRATDLGASAPESSATRASRSTVLTADRPAFTSQPLAGGFQYSFTIGSGEPLTPESLAAYEPPTVELPVTTQEINVPDIDKVKADTAPKIPDANTGAPPGGGTGKRPPRTGGPGGTGGGGRPRGPS